MSRLLELGDDLINSPAQAMRQVLQEPSGAFVAVAFAWGVLSQTAAQALSRGGFAVGAAIDTTLALGSAVVLVGLAGAFLHFFASLFGGSGRALDLLRLLALAYFPCVVLPAFALAGEGTLAMAQLGVTLWQLALVVVAVREVYELSNGQALLTLLSPLVLFAAALPALLLLTIILAVLTSL